MSFRIAEGEDSKARRRLEVEGSRTGKDETAPAEDSMGGYGEEESEEAIGILSVNSEERVERQHPASLRQVGESLAINCHGLGVPVSELLWMV